MTLTSLQFFDMIYTKQSIKDTIAKLWHGQMVVEAATKSSMWFMNFTQYQPQSTHPVWSTVGTNPRDTRKAIIKAKLLSGSYILQHNRARFNQYKVSGHCLMCGVEDEDVTHFLLRCEYLKDIRQTYMDDHRILYPDFDGLPDINKVALLLDYHSENGMCAGWDSESTEASTRNYIFNLHCRRTWFMNNSAPV